MGRGYIMYTKKVMDHFNNPRNVGKLDNPDAVGEVGNPVCGDIMKLFLKIDDGKITDIKFKTFGCGAAIATTSIVTVLAKGKELDEAFEISKDEVAEALDGLPSEKMHCSNLASDALKKAINNYKKGKDPDQSGEDQ
jgi:nitrogen fixation NifU-like protein